jgi:hypothetical protein
MRTLAALAAAVGLAAIAGPAAACLPPPPPNWDAWLGDPSVDIFLGRVESVETLPPVEEGSVIITPGVAHVRSVETIQGQPASDTARRRAPSASPTEPSRLQRRSASTI